MQAQLQGKAGHPAVGCRTKSAPECSHAVQLEYTIRPSKCQWHPSNCQLRTLAGDIGGRHCLMLLEHDAAIDFFIAPLDHKDHSWYREWRLLCTPEVSLLEVCERCSDGIYSQAAHLEPTAGNVRLRRRIGRRSLCAVWTALGRTRQP